MKKGNELSAQRVDSSDPRGGHFLRAPAEPMEAPGKGVSSGVPTRLCPGERGRLAGSAQPHVPGSRTCLYSSGAPHSLGLLSEFQAQ